MNNQMSLRQALAWVIIAMDYIIGNRIGDCTEIKQAREIIYQMLERERKNESLGL
jgi:thymidine phosphorylase